MNPIAFLSDIMLQVLNVFYAATGNYGWAIILLTVVVNLALYPLTFQSVVQMAAMQRLQPKMKKIQEELKDKPDKLQKELADLYKTEKVNPLGGCLPLLLKIPFFIALFLALQSNNFKQIIVGAGGAGSFLWMHNLAVPDPSYVLVTLIGLTTYLSQKTMPGQGEAPGMGGMMMFMPFFIAFVSIPFPSGVQLYWVVTNLVAVGQQLYIARIMKK
ncbi:MAG: membrane protein insertase YidC [Candidatus Saganbacteria bacterium]|nr:membrane protein insertase YidC [Candidatus Saganbacteria bacterium]